jgi:DNA-directed RNA polymerase specialized sigma24 family protein
VYGEPLHQPAAADEVGAIADFDALERAFLRIPLDQRVALVLTHYAGYSAPEVAGMLGVPTGTVYSRIHNGARAMRQALAQPPVAAPTTETSR